MGDSKASRSEHSHCDRRFLLMGRRALALLVDGQASSMGASCIYSGQRRKQARPIQSLSRSGRIATISMFNRAGKPCCDSSSV
jgi:hypothetical protein